MIEPFESGQIRESGNGRIISYGTSSYGYDVRCADEFKIFTNINSAIVDPKNFDDNSFVDIQSDVCIIPPNSFALARTVEYFRIPRTVLTICLGKSTYARCGIIVMLRLSNPNGRGTSPSNFPIRLHYQRRFTLTRALRKCCFMRLTKSVKFRTRTAVASTRDNKG